MCYLRIEKYEERYNKKSKKIVISLGHDHNHEQDFIHFKYLNVTRLGHDHNHEQEFAQHIKKDLNDKLKRCAVDFPKTKTQLFQFLSLGNQ